MPYVRTRVQFVVQRKRTITQLCCIVLQCRHGGWFYGMPELCLMSCPSVLDVTSDAVYEFLTAFLTEMAQIFVDPVMMLGGDEVGLDTRDPVTGAPLLLTCFDLDPKASAWLKSHDMLSANVTAYFWKRVTTEVVPKVNRTAMVWFGMPSTGDPPLAQLPASTIANVWYVPTKEAPRTPTHPHTHVRV